jgi:hypothetical protein
VEDAVKTHMQVVTAREQKEQAEEDASRLESTGSKEPCDYVVKMCLVLSPKLVANPPLVKLKAWVSSELKTAGEQEVGQFHFMGLDTEGTQDGKANYVQIAGPFSPSIYDP